MLQNMISLAVGIAACYMTAHLMVIPTGMVIPRNEYDVVV